MSTNASMIVVLTALPAMWFASLAVAADSMPDKDMSSMPGMHMPAQKSPKAQKPAPAPNAPSTQAPRRSTPQSPPTPAVLQRLDIGSQIGLRPVVRGLNLPVPQAMPGMKISSMQGGKAPPGARSPDYSDGVGYGSMTGMDMHDDALLGALRVDRLEYEQGRHADGVALDAQAWYGTDANRLWLKAEGEDRPPGRLQDWRTEALWDHPVGIYWNSQLGIRQDFGDGPGRSWAAFGLQGLAPNWFDIEATAYLGPSGRTAARFEATYELLFTQRLILQPRFEANLYGRNDRERRIGAGLSDAQLGLRLRYEIRRQFAPYVGVELVRRFAKTAQYARNAGESAFDPQWVAGVRLLF